MKAIVLGLFSLLLGAACGGMSLGAAPSATVVLDRATTSQLESRVLEVGGHGPAGRLPAGVVAASGDRPRLPALAEGQRRVLAVRSGCRLSGPRLEIDDDGRLRFAVEARPDSDCASARTHVFVLDFESDRELVGEG